MKSEDLKLLLGWERIIEEERPIRTAGGPGDEISECFRVYRILPRTSGWPSINLVCGPDDVFEQLEFGAWDDYLIDGHEADLSEALVLAGELIKRRKFLIEELNKEGISNGAGLYDVGEDPLTLRADTVLLNLVFFDREPRLEPVDEGKYIMQGRVRMLRLSRSESEIGG